MVCLYINNEGLKTEAGVLKLTVSFSLRKEDASLVLNSEISLAVLGSARYVAAGLENNCLVSHFSKRRSQ